jgi:SAM-dependent methyltransferase
MNFLGVLLRLTAAALGRKSAFHHVFLDGKRVLDIACGQGQLATHDRGAYVGIDISNEMLGAARARGFAVVRGDATRLPFRDKGFQAVNCAQLIEHLPPAQAAEMLFEAARVLEPGGILLLRSPMPATVWNTFSHVRPYPPMAVRKLIRTQTEAYVRGGHRNPLPFQIEFVLYHGPIFECLPMRALAALWGVMLPFGRSGYAMVLRRTADTGAELFDKASP